MNYLRLFFGAVLAFTVTVFLFVLMPALIEMADKGVDDKKRRKIADIQMPDVEITNNLKEVKPAKPEDPQEPPPDMEQPDMDDVDANPDALNMSPKVAAIANIGMGGLSSADGEYLPIVKVAPMYPRRAQSRGVEGYCTIEYIVTKLGSIKDPVAVDCIPKGYFERQSIKAANKFKYKPRVVDGEAIEVFGVQNRFTYELEK